jgi:hypothetical protein
MEYSYLAQRYGNRNSMDNDVECRLSFGRASPWFASKVKSLIVMVSNMRMITNCVVADVIKFSRKKRNYGVCKIESQMVLVFAGEHVLMRIGKIYIFI